MDKCGFLLFLLLFYWNGKSMARHGRYGKDGKYGIDDINTGWKLTFYLFFSFPLWLLNSSRSSLLIFLKWALYFRSYNNYFIIIPFNVHLPMMKEATHGIQVIIRITSRARQDMSNIYIGIISHTLLNNSNYNPSCCTETHPRDVQFRMKPTDIPWIPVYREHVQF